MKTKDRASGFSLVEMLIATGILVIVMAAIYTSLYGGTREYEVNSRRAWSLHQARLAVDEISEDLRQATRLSMQPVTLIPPAPSESVAANNISFLKVLPSKGGLKQETLNYITYMWVKSGNTTVTAPVGPPTANTIPGSTWIDANGNGVQDDGMLVRIDPNPTLIYDQFGVLKSTLFYPPRIMCNYLKNDPAGFKVSQSMVTVNGEKMLQIHVVMTLVFTDSVNKVLEQTVESKVFVRNLQ